MYLIHMEYRKYQINIATCLWHKHANVCVKIVNLLFLCYVFYLTSFKDFITARKRSLRRLCFYTCQSVILFTGRGVCLSACWDSKPPGADPPGADTPQEQTPLEQTPPGTDTPAQADTPPPAQCMLGDTANKWAVRILLECILVVYRVEFDKT